MSGASSDQASESNGPTAPLVANDESAAARPLDFSGWALGCPENPPEPRETGAGVDPGISEDALDAAALSDALCAKLAPVSFGDRVFLFSSEAEAWRYALETMRRYHRIVGRPKRRRLIVCAESAEGAGGSPLGSEGDGDIILLPTDDFGAVAASIDDRTAGILIAPVRTKGRFELAPRELLARLRETADEYGLALAYDESCCGFGRTGMLWAHEWTGVPPDMMVAVHRRDGASPLAALVVTQRFARGAPGPLPPVDRAALLAGRALIEALTTPGVLERVQNRGWRLEDRLAQLFYSRRGAFTALGGVGLMQWLECPGEAEPMRAALAEQGLLTRAMGPFLGLLPRLAVEDGEIDAATSIIDRVCAQSGQ